MPKQVEFLGFFLRLNEALDRHNLPQLSDIAARQDFRVTPLELGRAHFARGYPCTVNPFASARNPMGSAVRAYEKGFAEAASRATTA